MQVFTSIGGLYVVQGEHRCLHILVLLYTSKESSSQKVFQIYLHLNK